MLFPFFSDKYATGLPTKARGSLICLYYHQSAPSSHGAMSIRHSSFCMLMVGLSQSRNMYKLSCQPFIWIWVFKGTRACGTKSIEYQDNATEARSSVHLWLQGGPSRLALPAKWPPFSLVHFSSVLFFEKKSLATGSSRSWRQAAAVMAIMMGASTASWSYKYPEMEWWSKTSLNGLGRRIPLQ